MAPEGVRLPLGIEEIQRLLPHRYPFLLIDRIVDLGETDCVALKNVTINEPFFVGHFPEHPIMPGVLILEAMAQTSAVQALLAAGRDRSDLRLYLVALERARFRKPVVPGDQLRIHSTMLRGQSRIWKFRSQATVEGQVAAEAEYLATIQP
ncbi:MAG: 3-hydroxyacyl-ACP dehydratase FabZ [Myxococcales bacterium]|nr:3-hydroxyacyl-ACP dehydratase FabZ [Myxococcota bacterium]MDW8280484.1 3-hydroxyacyl-ACP dehydratase FabZ [Myxococcales bacterium]